MNFNELKSQVNASLSIFFHRELTLDSRVYCNIHFWTSDDDDQSCLSSKTGKNCF